MEKNFVIILFSIFIINLIASASFGEAKKNMSPLSCVDRLASGNNTKQYKLPRAGLRKLHAAWEKRGANQLVNKYALLVDYTKNSKDKRSYVIDFKKCTVESEDYVAHGGAVYTPKYINYGNPSRNGMLEVCFHKDGTRRNLTRPGLYETRGCHITKQSGWPIVYKNCHGVKLHGLEKSNYEAMERGIVLHEHIYMKSGPVIKAMGQGCGIYPPGHLKNLMRFNLQSNTLVLFHAPQCVDTTKPLK